MTKKQKQISLGALAAVAAIAVPVATVVSCGSKKTEGTNGDKNNKNKVTKQQKQTHKKSSNVEKLDKDKVNLVSLGDSVAAGFTMVDGNDHRGFMDANGKVSGISYGSYLAKAFKAESKLGDFNNFAIAGATTATLANQVDPTFTLDTKGKADKARIEKDHVKVATEKARMKTIQAKIKKANVVTISIGANDVLGGIKFAGSTIGDILKNGLPKINLAGGLDSLIDYDEVALKAAAKKAKDNLQKTVDAIKKLNPDTKIIMVGYPLPLVQLSAVLNMVKKNGDAVVPKILNEVDNISRDIAKKSDNIDYINTYTNRWDKNATQLSPELFDIHPGVKGYKIMAATILGTLSGNMDNVDTTPVLYGDIDAGSDEYETRLGVDYKWTIEEYVDLKHKTNYDLENDLLKKEKRYKIVHFTAKVIKPMLAGLKAHPPAAPALNASDIYGEQNSVASTAMKLMPFIQNVFAGANAGLLKGGSIATGVKKDIEYIWANLWSAADAAGLANGLIGIVHPTDSSLKDIKGLLGRINTGMTTAHAKSIIAAGPATDYTK